MTVTINGTTGIAGTNGSAGTPAVQGEDTNTGIFFPAADTVAVATGGAERVRIDSSGNVGIGVTPNAWQAGNFVALQVGTGASIAGRYVAGTEDQIYISTNSYNDGAWKYKATGAATNYYQDDGLHVWRTAASGTAGAAITWSESMRIDASGNLLVNRTGPDGSAVFQVATKNNYGIGVASGVTTTQYVLEFRNGNGVVGTVTTSGTTTAYNTSSDYRLKENVAPMQNALDTVAQLNPVTYTWKADGSAGQGFIAHELQAVVPDCVTGEKDAVDAEGNPQYQGVDTSFLVATLVKAIQELTARVAELEAK